MQQQTTETMQDDRSAISKATGVLPRCGSSSLSMVLTTAPCAADTASTAIDARSSSPSLHLVLSEYEQAQPLAASQPRARDLSQAADDDADAHFKLSSHSINYIY